MTCKLDARNASVGRIDYGNKSPAVRAQRNVDVVGSRR
jgi:hypothetical protein